MFVSNSCYAIFKELLGRYVYPPSLVSRRKQVKIAVLSKKVYFFSKTEGFMMKKRIVYNEQVKTLMLTVEVAEKADEFCMYLNNYIYGAKKSP